MDKKGTPFPEKRESARVPDAFNTGYVIISQNDFDKKAPIYTDRRTVERQEFKKSKGSIIALDWPSIENERDCSPSLVRILSHLDKKLDLILSRQEEIFKKDQSLQQEKEKFESGQFIDISGTGARIFATKELREGTLLELVIEPPTHPPVHIATLGKVIGVFPKNKDGKKGFEISLEFAAINEDDREDLIKYIFKRQRELISIRKRENDDL